MHATVLLINLLRRRRRGIFASLQPDLFVGQQNQSSQRERERESVLFHELWLDVWSFVVCNVAIHTAIVALDRW